MANPRTIKIRYYRSRLAKLLLEKKEAREVENRYRTIGYLLYEKHKHILDAHQKEEIREFMKDILWADREVRSFTEGMQKPLKNLLEQEKLVELHS